MGQSAVIEVICRGIQRYWCSTAGYNPKRVQWSIISAVTFEPVLNESLWILLSFISVSYSSHTASSPFVFVPHMKIVPKSLVTPGIVLTHCHQKTSLIPWMFWVMLLLPLILPIIPGNLFCIFLAHVPVAPVAPRAALLRPAGMAKGTGTAGILDHPGLQQPTHHHQQPIKTRSFPLQTPRKSLQVPSHHILGHKAERFSNPWLSITTSSSKWVVWIHHWFDC